MDRQAWRAIVHSVAESDMIEVTSHTHTHTHRRCESPMRKHKVRERSRSTRGRCAFVMVKKVLLMGLHWWAHG